MPYCSSEQELQGYDAPQVELTLEEISEAELMIEVHITRPCASCGSEAAYYDLELTENIERECDADRQDPGASPTYELINADVEPVDDYRRIDRNGKPIRNPRYQRHLIGAMVIARVKCARCGAEFHVTAEDTVAASDFEVEPSH